MADVTDELCIHGLPAAYCTACKGERRERQRLAWIQFMAALLADGLDPVQGWAQADEALKIYNERWETDA